jgi:hypothetical protein
MYPKPERLPRHSFALKLAFLVPGGGFPFSLSQAVVVAPLCSCSPHGGVAAWLLPSQSRQEQLVQGNHRFFQAHLDSSHPACLSSASLSFSLRVGEGRAAVTRSVLDSLTFGGVPLLGHPNITHIITTHTTYYHGSFCVQHIIVTSFGTFRTS